MRTAILNVSLDKAVNPGPIQRRFDIVMAHMRLCFRDAVGEIAHVTYDGPDGPVQEACAVVTVSYEATRQILNSGIYALANGLGQDCIAVVLDDGQGECVGPGADRWPFDMQRFNRPAIFRALESA
jgi:hypothetical protein